MEQDNDKMRRSPRSEEVKLNCKQVSVLLSQAQDQPLSALERLRLEAHLKLCAGCENFMKQLEFLRAAIRRHPLVRPRDGDGE
ncbi:MAG TPA: zf-HC2 domain-containing protein [Burkholderiales bacterium]|nr:zf-HC2 domain-containing protein [Burkholderiales bacterium]